MTTIKISPLEGGWQPRIVFLKTELPSGIESPAIVGRADNIEEQILSSIARSVVHQEMMFFNRETINNWLC
ncbi:MAG: hypothetical protein GY847_36050 [Proteobacteria bacterium]|nr:hypothetical protein [Pseudomonadota bacterium]